MDRITKTETDNAESEQRVQTVANTCYDNTGADRANNPGKKEVNQAQQESTNSLYNSWGDPIQQNGAKLIFGDSNMSRMRVTDGKIKNVAISGAKFSDVQNMINAETETNVDSVCIHLGTNDLKSVEKNKIVQNALGAINLVNKKWPNCDIAFSSIIPRLGKSRAIKSFNNDAKFVNDAMLNSCLDTKTFHYIDNDELFSDKGAIVKSLYDARDPSGIHVNEEGARKLYKNLVAFLEGGISDEDEMQAPRNKRLRSNDSATSTSGSQNTKQAKTD